MSQPFARFVRLALSVALASPIACSAQPTPPPATPGDAAATTPAASSQAWNDRARFLAGLAVPESSTLAKLEQATEWKQHQKTLDEDWKQLGERLSSMDGWARAQLDGHVDPTLPLVYLFGGPDVITAVTLFPQAKSYLLAGLEPVGQVSSPEALPPKALDEALDALSYALRTTVRTSFFRTNEMGRDLSGKPKQEIKGVLPIVLLFLARAEARVTEVERLEIDAKTGVAAAKPETESFGSGIPAFRVTFQRKGAAAPQTLTYLRADVINDSLAKTPGFATFVKTFTPGNTLLKAASFILHDNNFSTTRELLLEGSAAILQEDSGVPYRFFKKATWETTCFGKYARPRPPFEHEYQADLAAYCNAQPARPLPFIIGYRRTDDTNLFLAVKKTGAVVETKTATTAAPVPAEAPAPGAAPAAPVPAVAPAPAATSTTPDKP